PARVGGHVWALTLIAVLAAGGVVVASGITRPAAPPAVSVRLAPRLVIPHRTHAARRPPTTPLRRRRVHQPTRPHPSATAPQPPAPVAPAPAPPPLLRAPAQPARPQPSGQGEFF